MPMAAMPAALRPLVDHAPDALLVLDFDGTISAIVEHPDDAVAVEGVIDTLCDLTRYLTVAFITGPSRRLARRPHGAAAPTTASSSSACTATSGCATATIVRTPSRGSGATTIVTASMRVRQRRAPDDVVIEAQGPRRWRCTSARRRRPSSGSASSRAEVAPRDRTDRARHAVRRRTAAARRSRQGRRHAANCSTTTARRRWRSSVTTSSTSPRSMAMRGLPRHHQRGGVRRQRRRPAGVRRRSPTWCCRARRRRPTRSLRCSTGSVTRRA